MRKEGIKTYLERWKRYGRGEFVASFNIGHFERVGSGLGWTFQLPLLPSPKENGAGLAGMLAGNEDIRKKLFLMRGLRSLLSQYKWGQGLLLDTYEYSAVSREASTRHIKSLTNQKGICLVLLTMEETWDLKWDREMRWILPVGYHFWEASASGLYNV